MYDLSVIIPARNEMFLKNTVEDILLHKKGNTEVIVGLDGEWPDPPLVDHPDLTILYYPSSIGQRAITNQCVRMSKAKYIMKIDAHCSVDEGFDVKMMEEMKDDYTMIPAMYNFHVFNWVCQKCGERLYQGRKPANCKKCGGKIEREMVWTPRWNRRSECYRFDLTLHFQYHSARKKQIPKEIQIVETMSAQGSCFMLTRQKYWELNICDENHGSWGQQGTEVALKTWLSGGRLVTNRKTWYSHMFRTQGGDFGFPYPLSGSQVGNARKYSRDLFVENKWPGLKYPLSWLLEKFNPLPEWHEKKGKEMLDYVNKMGEEFYKTHPRPTKPVKKGIVFYTRNKVNMKLGHAVRKTILRSGLPIVSVSSKPMKFGFNIPYSTDGGYLEMAEKILLGLKTIETDIVFFCEDDVLYHYSHFDFTPARHDVYYYDLNFWRIRSADGFALHYDAKQLNLICGYRNFLIKHYEERVKKLRQAYVHLKMAKREDEFNKYVRAVGFEPGTHHRNERVDDFRSETWASPFPSLDIRHTTNLTANRWKKEQFRSQNNCQNWIESDIKKLQGWNFKGSTFEEMIKSI